MREMLLLLALGCAGAVDDEPVAEPADETPTAAPEERVISLCAGSPPEAPELCQQLRYGDRGYCNFWHECAR